MNGIPRRVTLVIDLGVGRDDPDAIPEEGELVYRSLHGYAQVIGHIESKEEDYREEVPDE